MFEKEAEEYAKKVYGNSTEMDHYGIADAFEDGAEFGYNKANEWHKIYGGQMTVVAEFEKPKKCEDCPCFYQTEGAFKDECQLTHKEIENYFIVDKSCPLKAKEKE